MKITEGYLPYLGYQTYYRIIGEGHPDLKPLVFLHGGPGSTHNYFELFDDFATTGRQLIMYDQLGCGKSYVENRPDLWQSSTWVNELIALKDHLGLTSFHLLGQSWGGMLAIEYLCDHRPLEVCSVILSSTLPASQLWGQEQLRLIRLMSDEDQQAINRAIEQNDFTSEAYLTAEAHYMLRYSADIPTLDSPEPLRRQRRAGRESYVTAWGPNEFYPIGTLKNWDYRDKLKNIIAPALIISGSDDLSTPLVAKTMADGITNSQWELFAHSRHMPFVDEPEKYFALLNQWLTTHDTK